MIAFRPAPLRTTMGQIAPIVPPAQPAVPPPGPDPLFVGYTGLPGLVEALAVLAVTSSAAWIGIRAGMKETDVYLRAAGWVGGIGSALFGLLYLGGKSGLGQEAGIPAVRVTPS